MIVHLAMLCHRSVVHLVPCIIHTSKFTRYICLKHGCCFHVTSWYVCKNYSATLDCQFHHCVGFSPNLRAGSGVQNGGKVWVRVWDICGVISLEVECTWTWGSGGKVMRWYLEIDRLSCTLSYATANLWTLRQSTMGHLWRQLDIRCDPGFCFVTHQVYNVTDLNSDV